MSGCFAAGESEGPGVHPIRDRACRSGGRRIHLKVSERDCPSRAVWKDEEIRDVYCCCYP